MSAASQPERPAGTFAGPAEVRYSLPDLLREVELERSAPTFAMEKLDQAEIKKLFPRRKTRRASPGSK